MKSMICDLWVPYFEVRVNILQYIFSEKNVLSYTNFTMKFDDYFKNY